MKWFAFVGFLISMFLCIGKLFGYFATVSWWMVPVAYIVGLVLTLLSFLVFMLTALVIANQTPEQRLANSIARTHRAVEKARKR